LSRELAGSDYALFADRDFAIARNGQIIAGMIAVSAHAQWDGAGWTRKLHAAVVASGNPFVGPLQSPYEPWHYAYKP
jgi:hypothetical protein